MIFLSVSLSVSLSLCVCLLVSLSACLCLSACPQPSFVPLSLPLCAQPVFSSAFEFFSILIQVSPMIFLSVSLSVSLSLCVCLLVSLSACLCLSACPQPSFVPLSLPLCAQPVFSSAFEFFSILIQVSPMIFLSVSLSVSLSLCVCLLVSLSARLCVFLPAPNPPSFPLPSLSVLSQSSLLHLNFFLF